MATYQIVLLLCGSSVGDHIVGHMNSVLPLGVSRKNLQPPPSQHMLSLPSFPP